MKKPVLISALACLLSASGAFAQDIIGRIDNDGIYHMTVEKGQAKNILKSVFVQKGEQALNPTEILLTTMPLGQVCLTGYERDSNGKVTKGYRIMCKQDDANNLIVVPENKTEKIFGRPFAETQIVSE